MFILHLRRLAIASALLGCGAAATAAPIISEFSASTAGTDVEYVEVFSTPNADLSAYWILGVEGDSSGAGALDRAFRLGTTDADGFYLLDLAVNTLENGTLSLLLVRGFSGALGQDLDTDNNGGLDILPWLELVDSVAVNDGGTGDRTYGSTVLSETFDGLPFAPGGASRTAQGWVRNDFDLAGIGGFNGTPVLGEAYNTPGACNRVVVDLDRGRVGPSDCAALAAPTAVPLPGTLALALLALLALGLMRGVPACRRAGAPASA